MVVDLKYTPYDEINSLLHEVLIKARAILKDEFTGMYLYGSLSSGDFNPGSSDIDFVIITEKTLNEQKISALRAMHELMWRESMNKWATKLEGSYIYKSLIQRHDPNGLPCPTINEGKFYVDHRGSDWIIQRHIIREIRGLH